MKEERITVWKGCNSDIANAVESFAARLGPYSAQSRRYSIYRLVKETIDPQWQIYLATFQVNHVVKHLLKDQLPSEYAQKHGFRALEDWIIGVIRSYFSFSKVTKEKIDKEFVSTLETMRELAVAARLKRPKTTYGINTSRLRPICELCGQPTELETARQREYLDDTIGSSRLSARYCVAHRSWNHDGTYNADYKRAIRTKNKFENELARLSRQASKVSKACADTGDTAVDLFILNVVARRALYPDEKSVLREIARQLVERSGGVSDSKKRIVILLASGMTQSEVATYLNISRQAVSKALKSIPLEYRFDIQRAAN